jgi:hypothetical protein
MRLLLRNSAINGNRRTAGIAAAVTFILLLGGCSSDGNQQARSGGAPSFTVETFDGETFALHEHRGTPVVINFWESW